MSRIPQGGLWALVLAVIWPSIARADDPEGNVSLWFRPAWVYANLDQANDLIRDGNRRFAALDLAGMDSFHNTFYVGAELYVNVLRRVTAYAGYGSAFGSESKSFNRVIKTEISGNPITGGLLYRVPVPGRWEDALDDLDVFLGGGVTYMSGFEFTASDEDRTTAREFLEERVFSGDGLGFELRLNLEYFLTPKFTLMGGATYRALTMKDLEHSVRVNNPNAFNPLGDDDGDGLTNDRDPDYLGDRQTQTGGNAQRMYGQLVEDLPENPGMFIWQKPKDRYLQSLYVYDPNSYFAAPPEVQVYDPSAQFDLDMGGFSVQIGLSYYIF